MLAGFEWDMGLLLASHDVIVLRRLSIDFRLREIRLQCEMPLCDAVGLD